MMVDSRIGPYKFIREIAEDRLGHAFEATDVTNKKHVVIKSLRPEVANRPEIVSRLYSEAKTLARLNHPHIAKILGFIRRNDCLHLVMEFVDGESLQAILKGKTRLDPPVALAFFHQILSAVGFAHELGVIHGDLKPSNIMVSSFGQIKVLDFAIATILGSSDPVRPRVSTVRYLSPEQIRGEPVDVRSDIFSLGILLYEFIVGRAPFDRPGEVAPGASPESTPLPPSLLVTNCPQWLDAFVLRALAPSPADRFPSIAAMWQALGAPSQAKKIGATAKHRRAWRQGVALRVSSAPIALFAATLRRCRSLGDTFAATATIIRQKRAGVACAVRAGMETVNPATRFKGGALRINAYVHGLASVFRRISGNTERAITDTAGNIKKIIRQKNATIARAARRGMETIDPVTWTKRGAARLRAYASALQPGPMSTRRLFGSLKEKLAALSGTRWQRYIAITIVLASAVIETFIFGGTNTIFRHTENPLSAISQTGAAQSLLDQLDPTPIAASGPDPGADPQSKPVKRLNAAPRTAERPSDDAEPLHYQARISRRTVTYRPGWDKIPRPNVPEPRPAEPPGRNAENNTAKTQLNVKWEN
jgi:tRNA A-37 threonylcarbamoyl transferase component Bud32